MLCYILDTVLLLGNVSRETNNPNTLELNSLKQMLHQEHTRGWHPTC